MKKLTPGLATQSIPLSIFKKILQSTSIEQLESIPVGSFPEEIPEEIYINAPYQNRLFIEGYLFSEELNRVAAYDENVMKFGVEIADLIQTKNVNVRHSLPCDFNKHLDYFEKAAAEEQPYEEFQQWLRLNVHNLQCEYALTYKIIPLIRKAITNHRDDEKALSVAMHNLNKLIFPIQKSIQKYYLVRLNISSRECSTYLNKLCYSKAKIQKGEAEIKLIICQIANQKKIWKDKVQCSEEYQHLMRRHQINLDEIIRHEVIIDENKLLEWLDTVVDISLLPVSSELGSIEKKQIHAMQENLVNLLIYYCNQQESAAQQIIKNPFSVVAPEKSIHYYLKTEMFVLDYFEKKENQMTLWLAHVAKEKKKTMSQLLKVMLRQLKHSLAAQ